jgi:hypothetical protein
MKTLARRCRVSLFLAALPLAAGAAEPKAADFACTEIIGVSVTGDWFGAGFENGIAGDHWQARWREHAFIEQWTDPAADLWTMKLESPCAQRSDNPDRELFTGVNWEYTTRAQWEEKFAAVVEVIRKKYPGVKRIELLTMLRAPGNKTCGSDKTVVAPYIDEAIAAVVARYPRLVAAGAKVETDTCDVFTKGGPHFTPPGMAAVAKTYQKALAAR